MKTCNECQSPVSTYCGRCGVGICVDHVDMHRSHKELAMSELLKQELEEIVGAATDLPEAPPTLYDPDPYCGSCMGDGAVPVYSGGGTRFVPCACRYVMR